MLLGLKQVEQRAPADIAAELALLREATRDGLDEVRRVARQLRPGVLEDLGLPSALASLTNDFAEHSGASVRRGVAPGLPTLSDEAELVVYRVAQEALTNVARHAGPPPSSCRLTRRRRPGRAAGRRRRARLRRRRARAPACAGCASAPAWSAADLDVTSRAERRDRRSGSPCRWRRVSEPTRILLADDHALVRRGVRLILDSEPDLDRGGRGRRRRRGRASWSASTDVDLASSTSRCRG